MRRPFQFGLRALLLAVTGLGIWLGVEVNRARRQREIVSAIFDVGGYAAYDWQFVEGEWDRDIGLQETAADYPPGPKWLRRIVGDDFFQTVVLVFIFEVPLTDDQLPPVEQLPALKVLDLSHTQIGDASLHRIARLSRLRFLDISHTNVTDTGMDEVARLRRLKTLWLDDWRALPERTVGDLGLMRLAPLSGLNDLIVAGDGVTDRSVPLFEQFKELRRLCLVSTLVSEAGRARIAKSLPNCEVYWSEP
jgi:hypothetical protein